MLENEKVYCTEIKYEGEYKIKGLLPYSLKRNWTLQRDNTTYDIEIMTIMNGKIITIKTSSPVTDINIFDLLCKILRYECLWDGRFFKMQKIEVDKEDKTDDVNENILSYYEGKSAYSIFSQPLDDEFYRRGFLAWEQFEKKALNINQMFYYIGFTKGITADLRIALFSEIFEPLSEMLEAKKEIKISNSRPIQKKKVNCPRCNNNFEILIKKSPSFRDKLSSIIATYGKIVFDEDDVATILQKTVNTRNKMLHVDASKPNVLTGGQCGFYLRKFVELYRIIVFKEIGVWNAAMEDEITKSISFYNDEFQQLRIPKINKNDK